MYMCAHKLLTFAKLDQYTEPRYSHPPKEHCAKQVGRRQGGLNCPRFIPCNRFHADKCNFASCQIKVNLIVFTIIS